MLSDNLENTFNSISNDSDTSTSDTLALFSTSNKKINWNTNKNYEILTISMFELMHDLSQQVVKDGEGINKLIKITIF